MVFGSSSKELSQSKGMNVSVKSGKAKNRIEEQRFISQ
jgi:hypothetical protein